MAAGHILNKCEVVQPNSIVAITTLVLLHNISTIFSLLIFFNYTILVNLLFKCFRASTVRKSQGSSEHIGEGLGKMKFGLKKIIICQINISHERKLIICLAPFLTKEQVHPEKTLIIKHNAVNVYWMKLFSDQIGNTEYWAKLRILTVKK